MIRQCHGDLSLRGGWYISSQDLVVSIQASPSHVHGETISCFWFTTKLTFTFPKDLRGFLYQVHDRALTNQLQRYRITPTHTVQECKWRSMLMGRLRCSYERYTVFALACIISILTVYRSSAPPHNPWYPLLLSKMKVPVPKT